MRIAKDLRVLVLTIVCTPATVWGADTWTDPYPGVRHLYRTTATPNRIHVLKVDLSRADIRVRATKYADRRQTTSAFAAEYDCELAVNGDFFSYETYSTSGLSIGRGEKWSTTNDGTGSGFIAVGLDNYAELSKPGQVVNPPEDWMNDVVSGHPLLVENGAAKAFPDCTGFCARNPRTAVGLTDDGVTLILAVVDGRSSVSAGMSLPELANLMVDMGAHTALNLDGGGSSTMYVKNGGGVVNSPSDGSQRVVANHFGIAIVRPFGTVKGYVREGDIYDTTAGVAGATVTLSTGATVTTGADGYYEVTEVPVGPVTVTATATGLSGERMIAVYGEETSWGSIALVPEPEPEPEPEPDPEPGDPADPEDPNDMDTGVTSGCSAAPGGTSRAWPLLLVLVLTIAHRRGQLRIRGGIPHRDRRGGTPA